MESNSNFNFKYKNLIAFNKGYPGKGYALKQILSKTPELCGKKSWVQSHILTRSLCCIYVRLRKRFHSMHHNIISFFERCVLNFVKNLFNDWVCVMTLNVFLL